MLGALIGAGANIVGGLLGKSEKNKDRQMQKEFAQNGIRWKVEDAKAAGLHPLAALGAQTSSFSPVSVGSSDLSTGLAAAGQDVSRAVNATRTGQERVDAYGKALQDLQLQRVSLENDLLRSQIAKINSPAPPPAMPEATDRYLIEGQGNSPLVKDKALERVSAAPGAPAGEAGAVTDMGYARTRTGWAPTRSKDFAERSEDDWAAGAAWNVRNRLLPTLSERFHAPPPMVPLDAGKMWAWDPLRQEYRPVDIPPPSPKKLYQRYYR